ncbi:MaoC family dehydratase [Rhodococcus coprophilus]|uniref:Predicted nucleic-acid-binding protein containing a Zn-ribbon n=1 Tax=Rhodococcus coprophilus TaxID=38310 RepID=A0A2X4TWY8_9NOCA|nr:MaoC family dehydratase N-terminal domain-containing protein [Rhodococcus coprophilus]MBM7458299.1 acyl dehydratase [Rhodococcus coprophilus]SQI31966.1 Predicted nucleic-acid-binding protein containing a Zn-ribbon [Rhodococcus coprophilus]
MQTVERDYEKYVGQVAEPPRVARYEVNEAMIRNWAEAHDDFNPIYVDADAARATGRDSVVCPPAMISTWVMAGYRRWREVHRMRAAGTVEDFAYSRMLAELDSEGLTSVVATNVEQDYHRELVPGDRITAHLTIESVSPVKRTGLGEGRFFTLYKRYEDQRGELVAEERFRMLRFNPNTPKEA